MIVNGVTLPDIPAEVLAEKPNAVVTHTVIYGTDIYSLAVSSQPFDHGSAELLGQEMLLTHGEGQNYMLSNGVWDDLGTTSRSPFGVQLGEVTAEGMTMEYTLVWTNQTEFKEIVWIDLDTMEWGTEPKEEEPEYAERYSILGSILVGTARQIMRLTDSTEKVKPEEFEPKLEGINIQLQELTVTATEEVQTITPPSGVYGFSKVIVEAVESSGTGGGGTPGEGGDDPEPDTTPDISSGAFGNVVDAEGSEVYTGNYLYNGVSLPPLPTLDGYPYTVLYDNSSLGYCVLLGTEQFKQTSKTSTNATGGTTIRYLLRSKSDNGTWVYYWEQNGGNLSVKLSDVVWANPGILRYSGDSYYFPPMSAQAEMAEGVETKPAEVEGSYTVSGDDINRLGAVAQKITGSTEAMTWDEILDAIEGTT